MKTFELRNRYGQKFYAYFYTSDLSKNLVIIQHGFSGSAFETHIQEMVRVYLQNGYNVLALDCTNSFNDAEGDIEDATIGRHLNDLEDSVLWAQKQDWYQKPFALAGHSLGGFSTLLFTEQNSGKVMSLFAGSAVLNGTLRQEAYEEFNPEIFELFKRQGFLDINCSYRENKKSRSLWKNFLTWFDFDALVDAYKISVPVLLIVGDKDTACPPKHQKKLYDALQGPKKFHVITDANHCYVPKINEMGEILDQWLKATDFRDSGSLDE